jgi:hypothetical protein
MAMAITDPDLSYIVKHRKRLLREYDQRLNVLRDYVRSVVKGYSSGLYVFGRPGCGKTSTVSQVLEQEQELFYSYQRGHLSPKGLFGLFQEHHDELIVLDDITMIFKSEGALQLLLAALEPSPPGMNARDFVRPIRWKRERGDETVNVSGGLICISNLELHDDHLLEAFKSRVHVFNPDPTNQHIGALMLEIAEQGWPVQQPTISPKQCGEIARFVIAEMLRAGIRFDLRLLVNKAFPLYQQVIDGEADSHWQDLLRASIKQQLIPVQYPAGAPMTRAERKKNELEIVKDILHTYATREERVKAWCERTGKSQSAFYRAKAEHGWW